MKVHIGQLIQVLQFWPQRQQQLLMDISALLNDGVSLRETIQTIYQIHTDVVKLVAEDMQKAIAQGYPLAFGMEKWFPTTIVEIVRAGEEGGSFIPALAAAIHYYEARVTATKMMLQTLTYPLIVLTMALTILVIIKTSVFNTFASIKAVANWPLLGRDIYGIGNFVQHWWWFCLFLLLASGTGIYYMLQNVTGDMRHKIDKLPVLSLYRYLTAARFMEILGILVTNGLSLKQGLHIIHKNAQPYLSWHLMLMEFRLGGGSDNIADVLDTKLICPADMLRLRVMAKGKGFDQALVSLGRQALTRYQQRVIRLVRLTSGFMMLLTALLAAMMVLGIYGVGSMIAS